MTGPANALSSCPTWVRLAAGVIRHLPAGRYRALHLAARKPTPPFVRSVLTPDGEIIFGCDLRDVNSREVCFTGVYEPQESAILRALLKPGGCFVDVGANWGYFTLLAAHFVGRQGTRVAVEADPRMFAQLRANLARSAIPGAHAVHAAACDREAAVALAGYDEATQNFGLSRIVERTTGGITVSGRPLDAILNQLAITQVDLAKIDVEGAEDLVLEGMRQGLRAGRYRNLLLELHPAQLRERGRQISQIVSFLQQLGYVGCALDHSYAANRRACYQRQVSPQDFIRPLEHAAADPWPHTLWGWRGLPLLVA